MGWTKIFYCFVLNDNMAIGQHVGIKRTDDLALVVYFEGNLAGHINSCFYKFIC